LSNNRELEIIWIKQEDFELINKIDRGKSSDVYEGINANNDKSLVIKASKPVETERKKSKIKIFKI
jgi:casein kinase II subunit alpha